VDEREFARSMTEHANAHQLHMRGMSDEAATAYVCKIVADNELVIGVWQEPAGAVRRRHPSDQRASAACRGGRSPRRPEHAVGAVPCADREQAVAAERVFATSPTRGHAVH
jgi:hypothetical protein